MKTVKIILMVIILIASCKAARADLDDKAVKLGYGHAKDIEPTICDEARNFYEVRGQCNDLINRMKAGYLVKDADYKSWCGMAFAYKKKSEQYAEDYRKVYGKKFDFKRCQ